MSTRQAWNHLFNKIPSEMRVAPHYKLLQCLHWSHFLHCLDLFGWSQKAIMNHLLFTFTVHKQPNRGFSGCAMNPRYDYWIGSHQPPMQRQDVRNRNLILLLISAPLAVHLNYEHSSQITLSFICHSKSIRRILVEARQNIYLLLKFVPC